MTGLIENRDRRVRMAQAGNNDAETLLRFADVASRPMHVTTDGHAKSVDKRPRERHVRISKQYMEFKRSSGDAAVVSKPRTATRHAALMCDRFT